MYYPDVQVCWLLLRSPGVITSSVLYPIVFCVCARYGNLNDNLLFNKIEP